MKKVSDELGHEESNVVRFPQRGSSPYSGELVRPFEDPLEELLNEFAEFDDDDRLILGDGNLDNSKAAEGRSVGQKIQSRLRELEVATARIKYYVDDIDLFLPARKK